MSFVHRFAASCGEAYLGQSGYLKKAEWAVGVVRGKMRIGSQNQLGGLYEQARACIAESRGQVDASTPKNLSYSIAISGWGAGCGNCHEQAALAALVLGIDGVFPVDLMARTNADHVFAVVGRPAGAPIADPSRWGPAVICDPWQGFAYPASEAPQRMWGGQATQVEVGRNSGEGWSSTTYTMLAPAPGAQATCREVCPPLAPELLYRFCCPSHFSVV